MTNWTGHLSSTTSSAVTVTEIMWKKRRKKTETKTKRTWKGVFSSGGTFSKWRICLLWWCRHLRPLGEGRVKETFYIAAAKHFLKRPRVTPAPGNLHHSYSVTYPDFTEGGVYTEHQSLSFLLFFFFFSCAKEVVWVLVESFSKCCFFL